MAGSGARSGGFATLAVVLLLAAGAQALRHPVVLDDAYITFRYAQNLAGGNGLVFNPGERALSTTAPGLAVLLALPAWLGADIVTTARLLCALSLSGAALSLLALGWRAGRPMWGFSAGLLLCFFPDVAENWGNEASLLLLAAAGACLLYERGSYGWAAATLAAGCAVRPDFALLALTFTGALAWRCAVSKSWKDFTRFAAVGGLVAVSWMALLAGIAGEVVPHTLSVKQLQVEWTRAGDPRAAPQWRTWTQGVQHFFRLLAGYPPFLWWALPGMALTALPRRGADEASPLGTRVVALWAAVHLGAYTVLDVPGHHPWYLYPVWLWAILGAATALEVTRGLLARALRRAGATEERARHLALAFGGVFLVLCAASLEVRRIDLEDTTKYEAYRAISEEILERTRPDETMMLGEIGEIGYLTGRRVVDSHALIHPDLPEEDILDTRRLVQRFAPDLLVDEGWVTSKPPGYADAVSSGSLAVELTLPDGATVRYEQIAGEGQAPSTFMPAVLRRVDAPRP